MRGCNLNAASGELTDMKPIHRIAISLLAFCGLGAGPAPAANGPVVVELFTSQGCSSCPPANAVLNQLADRPDVLALSFGVTYWDQLGWKDRFASPQFTQRQWDYAKGLRHSNVWTPQMVIDGRTDTPGQRLGLVEPLIAAAKAKRAKGPVIGLVGDRVSIGAGANTGAAATVWLVRYDPRVVQVPIGAGENTGKTLPHRDVVREMVKLGPWTGSAARFAVKPGDAALRTAILVQSGAGGPILAAAKL